MTNATAQIILHPGVHHHKAKDPFTLIPLEVVEEAGMVVITIEEEEGAMIVTSLGLHLQVLKMAIRSMVAEITMEEEERGMAVQVPLLMVQVQALGVMVDLSNHQEDVTLHQVPHFQVEAEAMVHKAPWENHLVMVLTPSVEEGMGAEGPPTNMVVVVALVQAMAVEDPVEAGE